ncbi:MAG: alpha-L-rhamnosidase N-terminal domain-containing protein, partial [Bacilli bacterium]|nr:alpha-L-rhamnosidase N-terminal domain-containing protein [Bacilli bacterium]
MNKKSAKTIAMFVLAASLLASCGGAQARSSLNEGTADTSSVDEKEYVAPDRSKIKYISSIDKYKKTDWKASWIWDEKSIANSYVALRKKVAIGEVPSKAIAHISAVSKYYLYVNGTLVVYDGCPKQTATMVDSYYEDVDLTSYLKKGDNTIVALVNYVGRSSNSYIDCGAAGFLFEMDLGDNKVVSDNTWKVKRLKEWRNKTLLKDEWPEHPASSFIAEWDVYYDAREANGDYIDPSFDDSSWSNATTVGKVGYLPYGDTYISDMPLIKFSKDIIDAEDLDGVIGKKITEAKTVKFSLGENRQFSPYLELEAEAGAHLVYYTNTYETDSGKQFNFKDDYVAKAGKQSFESLPWRTGSILYIDVPAGVTLTKVGYRANGYATERTGKFVSDDANANQLWNEARNTTEICMRDTYMDCPDRERSPYAGDAANQFQFTFYGFDTNATSLIKKTLRTLPGWVLDDGIIPSRWPSNNTNEITIQNLAMIASFDDYYLHTSDVESLELVYPIAREYLKLWKMEANGLPEKRLGTFKWIDWGTGADSSPLYDEFYYLACQKMLHLGNALGHTEDASFYEARLDSIK